MKLLIITQKVDKNYQLLGFFIDWLNRFAAKFDKITIICLEKGEFKLPDNIEVVSMGKDRGYSKIRQLSTFYFLLSTSKYDAVFVHMNPIWVVLGGPAWRLKRKKTYFWYTHKAVTPKLRLAEKFADVIFSASKESFRLSSKKVIVTGHGINTDLFKPDSSRVEAGSGLKILSVGRISPVKNYETLIEAMRILKGENIEFSVTMVGEPALDSDRIYELKIKTRIKELGLDNSFKFTGKINHENLPGYYQSNDVFVHLSKTGSVDKTILEAMACGMKVLSSNDSARAFLPAELLFDESNPSELAAKILALKDKPVDPALREYVIVNHNLDSLINKISKKIIES